MAAYSGMDWAAMPKASMMAPNTTLMGTAIITALRMASTFLAEAET